MQPLNRISLLVLAGVLPVAFLALVSCSSENSGGGSGGANTSGGANASGGAAQGGSSTSGGANNGSGGMSGGTQGSGGAQGNGGSGTGGSNASGGASGGASANGGAGGSANGSSSGGAAGSSSAGASNGGSGPNGGASGASGASSGAGGSGGGNSTAFTLTSPNLTEGAMFASKYTCSDKGFSGSVMPALNWTEGPAGTKSYAITFIDVTLAKAVPPDSKGYHWVIWNIPASVKSLPEALTDAQVKALPAKENSAFLGPCPNFGTAPPTGSKTDTYEFTLYALSTETVDITGSNIVMAAETKLEANNLAKTKLSGKSNAANNK